MDVFLEYLMRKRTTAVDLLKRLGVVLVAFLGCVAVTIIFPLLGSFLTPYILLGMAAVVYGAYVWLRNFQLEYEYIFTNGELDIDVIKAQQIRKRMTSLSCKNIEVMASADNADYQREFSQPSISKKFDAVYDASRGDIYHVVFVRDGEKMMLTFQPPETLLEAMKTFNPRCIHIDEENAE